jgi:hypothetical protein
MSDVASEVVSSVAPEGAPKLAVVKNDPAPAAEEEGPPGPMVEHPSDLYETALEYDHTSKMPVLVLVVWVCAILGFLAYMAVYFVPDLALWGKP